VTGLAAGQVVGRASAVGGSLHMMLTGTRAPAETHRTSLFSLDVAGLSAGHRIVAPAAYSPIEISAERRVKRSLYVEGPWYPLRARIVGTAQAGAHLAVVTSRELRVARVGGGMLIWRGVMGLEGAPAIAATASLVVVASG